MREREGKDEMRAESGRAETIQSLVSHIQEVLSLQAMKCDGRF